MSGIRRKRHLPPKFNRLDPQLILMLIKPELLCGRCHGNCVAVVCQDGNFSVLPEPKITSKPRLATVQPCPVFESLTTDTVVLECGHN